MTDTFTPAARDLIAKKVLAHVASLDPDGSPNVSPVWTELDGDDLVITTSLGRAKARNLATDPRVAVSIVDPDDDDSLITLRGSVVGFTTDRRRRGQRPTGEEVHGRRLDPETRKARSASPCGSNPTGYRTSPSSD